MKLGYVIPEFHCIHTILEVVEHVRYKNEKIDDLGYTHSIDMVIIDYLLKGSYKKISEMLCKIFENDGVKSSLDNLPNFKYQYYVDMVWCDGIVFHLGKYTDYDKESKTWSTLDVLRLEVNPNKHLGTPKMDKALKFINEWCSDGVLIRYDYAIDIPVHIDDVLVIGSRKEKGLYRGTRYFGRRHNHGYLKIYDKAKEQRESMEITRVEYTYKAGEIPSWENIVVRASVSSSGDDKQLSGTVKLYLDMLMEIKALGGQIEPYLERMNYRTLKQIEPYLYSGVQLQLDQNILDDLLNCIMDEFIITKMDDVVNGDDFVEAGNVIWEDV